MGDCGLWGARWKVSSHEQLETIDRTSQSWSIEEVIEEIVQKIIENWPIKTTINNNNPNPKTTHPSIFASPTPTTPKIIQIDSFSITQTGRLHKNGHKISLKIIKFRRRSTLIKLIQIIIIAKLLETGDQRLESQTNIQEQSYRKITSFYCALALELAYGIGIW